MTYSQTQQGSLEQTNCVISVQNLSRHFGKVAAIEDINFTIQKGEFVSIMGPSGSGKTTLLNILSCLDTPTTGEYFIDGISTSHLNDAEQTKIRRDRIGLVFQQFHLLPYLTAVENLMLAQHYHSTTNEDDAMSALEQVGLEHRAHHRPSQLSGGEQQRVCIARALINEPSIILADEPTGNLDETNEALIMDMFRHLHKQGRTIILVTHNPNFGNITQRTLNLSHGKLEA